jgi:cyclic pyranopterin phosphate synthase
LTSEDQLLTSEELLRAIEVFVDLGVRKIRLTGGEPTLRKDIVNLATRITQLGIKDLGITTNGLLLNRLGSQLKTAGVKRLNISLDTLDSNRFERITKRAGHGKVVQGIAHALNLGFDKVKINCVVKRGVNEDEIPSFVHWTRDVPLEIRFLEHMPFGRNGWEEDSVVSYAEMVSSIRAAFPDFHELQDTEDLNPTAKIWKVPGFKGRIGFITAMTDEFCGTCNRLRLTADGNVKACLFGEEEVSLRDAIRKRNSTKDDLIQVIDSAVKAKKEKLGGYDSPNDISKGKNRPMILIGG